MQKEWDEDTTPVLSYEINEIVLFCPVIVNALAAYM